MRKNNGFTLYNIYHTVIQTLMGLDFFERVMFYEQKYARPGMTIQNALQTNGRLLDEAWCLFFKKHDFLTGLSKEGL